VPNFYFGCEADDPMNAAAFNTRVNPFGVKLKAVFSSDIGHWDVPDMTEVVEEAYELVEHGTIDEHDLHDFMFVNPARLWTDMNANFFKGTVVESQVQKLLAGWPCCRDCSAGGHSKLTPNLHPSQATEGKLRDLPLRSRNASTHAQVRRADEHGGRPSAEPIMLASAPTRAPTTVSGRHRHRESSGQQIVDLADDGAVEERGDVDAHLLEVCAMGIECRLVRVLLIEHEHMRIL
jgi:hypothetical protein